MLINGNEDFGTRRIVTSRIGQRTGKFKPCDELISASGRARPHNPALLGLAVKENVHNLARHDLAA